MVESALASSATSAVGVGVGRASGVGCVSASVVVCRRQSSVYRRLVHPSGGPSVSPPVGSSVGQLVRRSIDWSVRRSVGLLVYRSFQSSNRPFVRPFGLSVLQSVGGPVSPVDPSVCLSSSLRRHQDGVSSLVRRHPSSSSVRCRLSVVVVCPSLSVRRHRSVVAVGT